jgi:hypothetical protein
VIPLGASTPLGALGYVRAAIEIDAQLRDHPHAGDTWIFVSASSCGTYAGLALGFTLLERTDVRLVGVSPDIGGVEILEFTEGLASRAGSLLGAQTLLLPGLLHPTDDYVGPGYGIHSDASEEATALLARTEGVLLDPAYSQDRRRHAGLGPEWPGTTSGSDGPLAHGRIPHGPGALAITRNSPVDSTSRPGLGAEAKSSTHILTARPHRVVQRPRAFEPPKHPQTSTSTHSSVFTN